MRLGDSKLLERIRTLEVEADENDEYCDDLEQQLEQLGAEKGSLQSLVGELQVCPVAVFPMQSLLLLEIWLFFEVAEL